MTFSALVAQARMQLAPVRMQAVPVAEIREQSARVQPVWTV